VLRADAIFRAVPVGAGEHTVAFRYAPRSLYVGLAVSAVALALVVAMIAFGRRRSVERDSVVTRQVVDRG
jgi:hypothetical protein